MFSSVKLLVKSNCVALILFILLTGCINLKVVVPPEDLETQQNETFAPAPVLLERTHLVLLGTGNPNADPQKFGPSLVIMVNNVPYFVDCGTGIVRRSAAANHAGVSGIKLKAFEYIYRQIHDELGPPQLIVYLKCDAETELKRIRRRARPEENSINLKFLFDLNNALHNKFEKTKDFSEVLTINSSIKDFANDESIKKEMIELITDFIARKG